MNNKALRYLSLAAKSRNIVSGEFSTENAIKSGEAKLVVVAQDASEGTKKKFRNSCDYYQIPFYVFSEKMELGHAIGKECRASAAFLDVGLAEAFRKQVEEL